MKLHQENKKILNGVNFAANQTSESDFIGDSLAVSLQFIWSGAVGAGGDLIVEGSIDNATFVPVEIQTIAGETSGAFLVNIERAGYSYIRARWVYTAGVGGLLTVWQSSKRM